jgi:hypothetical protein
MLVKVEFEARLSFTVVPEDPTAPKKSRSAMGG